MPILFGSVPVIPNFDFGYSQFRVPEIVNGAALAQQRFFQEEKNLLELQQKNNAYQFVPGNDYLSFYRNPSINQRLMNRGAAFVTTEALREYDPDARATFGETPYDRDILEDTIRRVAPKAKLPTREVTKSAVRDKTPSRTSSTSYSRSYSDPDIDLPEGDGGVDSSLLGSGGPPNYDDDPAVEEEEFVGAPYYDRGESQADGLFPSAEETVEKISKEIILDPIDSSLQEEFDRRTAEPLTLPPP
jgi:hypothetical protein